MTESPIFVRTYDFIQWLIPRTMGFPRSQRFILTKRLQDSVLDFYEVIIAAATAGATSAASARAPIRVDWEPFIVLSLLTSVFRGRRDFTGCCRRPSSPAPTQSLTHYPTD